MNKEFVPYELALKLKQLGFDERCFKYEDVKKICENHEQPGGCQLPNVHCGYPNCTIDRSIEPLGIPIWQQAFRWFREEYGLQHDITLTADKELTGFYVLIHKLDGLVFNEDDAVELDIETTNREDVELIILNKMIEIVTKQQEQ
jgi:hypothetical protein